MSMIQAAPAARVGTIQLLMGIAPWLLIFVIFYLLMIRPQQRRVKEHQAAINAVKKGDDVITAGGIRGRVTKVSDEEAEVEIAPGRQGARDQVDAEPGAERQRQAGERLKAVRPCSIFPAGKYWLVTLVVAARRPFVHPQPDRRHAAAKVAGRRGCRTHKINLGLDLAGGSHLLLEADQRDALKQRLQAKEDEVSTELRRDPRIDIGDISTAGGRLSFLVRDPTQVDAAVERMRKLTQPVALTGNRDWDVQVVDSTRIVLTPTPSGTAQALKDAMSVARDVVRRRIDPGGTKEITVITEGGNRILVEVPGRRGSRGAEAADRPDRAARVQAGRPDGQPADVHAGPRAAGQPGAADGRSAAASSRSSAG